MRREFAGPQFCGNQQGNCRASVTTDKSTTVRGRVRDPGKRLQKGMRSEAKKQVTLLCTVRRQTALRAKGMLDPSSAPTATTSQRDPSGVRRAIAPIQFRVSVFASSSSTPSMPCFHEERRRCCVSGCARVGRSLRDALAACNSSCSRNSSSASRTLHACMATPGEMQKTELVAL